ncbi:hypothetical protein NSQ77_15330 [Oceanobacillus sp. FSL K6-2867]
MADMKLIQSMDMKAAPDKGIPSNLSNPAKLQMSRFNGMIIL